MINNIEILLSPMPLSIDACYSSIQDESCGGNTLFIGSIRNHNKGKSVVKIDFEAYEPMAIKEMQKIAEEAIKTYDIRKVSIHHRTGETKITDIAVIIAVSSAHRDASFKACRFCIDKLKETVPIWKKEFLEDGSWWVGSRP